MDEKIFLDKKEIISLIEEFNGIVPGYIGDIIEHIKKKREYRTKLSEYTKKLKEGDILLQEGASYGDIEYYDITVIGDINFEEASFTGHEKGNRYASPRKYMVENLYDLKTFKRCVSF